MKVLRTPEARFEDLPDYPFTPHYVEIDAGDAAGTRLRVHYVDERPSEQAKASGETVLGFNPARVLFTVLGTWRFTIIASNVRDV